MVDVAVQSAQGIRGRSDGEVHRGELAFGERSRRPTPALPVREGVINIVVVHNCVVLSETN